MAHKKKTKEVGGCCASPMGDYKPTLYLNLEGQDVKQIKGLAVGEEVELVITGKVTSLSQRKSYNDKDSGSIDLESYRVRVMGEEDNEYKELADDEE